MTLHEDALVTCDGFFLEFRTGVFVLHNHQNGFFTSFLFEVVLSSGTEASVLSQIVAGNCLLTISLAGISKNVNEFINTF
jgi:hypothetical protein